MPAWKKALLTVYYHATYPWRYRRLQREAAEGRLPVIALFYHRIADDLANPWTVSNAMFLRQMEWLQNRFDLISLEEAQTRIRSGSNARPSVTITFDDGYADNCQQAIPWLVKERIPFTYFVTVRNVLSAEPFSHDLVTSHSFATNNLEQIKMMASSGVEIGCHAYTHADLGPLRDPRLLQYEIATAKDALQNAVGTPIRYFSFPFGLYPNLSPAAFAIAKQAGYAGVCSAYGGFNFPGDDAFHIQRVPVDNDMIRLKNWVTEDPRKLRIKRFQYEGVAVQPQEPETDDSYSRSQDRKKGNRQRKKKTAKRE